MTSPANQQNTIPATSSATSGSSYASAAGAQNNKPAQTPLVAAGSQPAPSVAPSAAPAQNATSASPSSLNGKSAIAPAVPAVARNGPGSEHARKSSVTMAANGPNSYGPNGGAAAGAKSGIQFGYDSPAMAHSTPQTGNSAPIPIPSANARVPSPAHSPSPIPQPSASGGGLPSGLQQPSGQMTFGSLGSDGERHMRQGSVPTNPSGLSSQPGTHFRRESSHSIHSDNNSGPARGGFQGGRGRGGYNAHNNYNNQMGYPPHNQMRNGPGQGRAMAPAFQPGQRNMGGYPNSPQPNRSPALVNSLPGTPNMAPAAMQSNMAMQTPPNYHYTPPMGGPQHQQNFGYPPQQLDQYGRPMQVPYGYNGMPYMPPQANNPGYNQPYMPQPYHPAGHSMSRTSSQADRPSSAHQQSQPVVVSSSTPQQQSIQPKPSNEFVKPRKSGAIQIKNPNGELIDTTKLKPSASPAPSSQQARTPPATTASPTPPSKPVTPAHARTDSQPVAKTSKQIQDELKEKIRLATQQKTEEKTEEKPEEKPAQAEVKAAQTTEAPVATETEAEKSKPVTEPTGAIPAASTAEAAPTEAPKTEAKNAEASAEKSTPAAAPADEDDEMERMIREMEEAEAAREKAEEEHQKKRAAEKAEAAKKAAAEKPISAAEMDKKLREQEREMERLEEEKEAKRRAAEESGKTLSVADLLAGKEAPAETKVDEVAGKLSGMNIDDSKPSSPSDAQKPTTAEKRGAKPLNLAPLNTKPVEPPQPSAALQSLKSARFLHVMDQNVYPPGIKSPNPSLNAAVTKKGKTFKYDANFLLQFQKVFTEQPSLEFGQQVKSLIGDNDGSRSAKAGTPGSARSSSHRGGGGAFGQFSQPADGGRPLAARGTTSAERFAAASRPGVNPMASFRGPGGAFPSMSRNPSQSNVPNSPRQGSRSTRGSRRGDFGGKSEAQAAKTMPLTAGQELKPIAVTSSGWKPTSITAKPGAAGNSGPGGYMDPEMVQRKVKAALNKMTPEKFDKIADQILAIASQSKDETDGRTLRQVIQLTFEKATDEAHWASMYAKFCRTMLDTMSPEIRDEGVKDKAGNVVSGGNLFRKYLLNRCQEEFEKGWASELPAAPESDEKDGEQKTGEAAMLSDEYYKAAAAKRRGLGLVQFIGELYKLGMLTERIMHECVQKLVDYRGTPDEAEIESLSKLLRTIGANLDATEKSRPLMDAYFERISNMTKLPDLASRMKFMLMDIIDLRRANWVSKEGNKGPKTLEEVRADAEAAQAAKAQENARTNQRGGGGGRPPAGRGDARNFSANFQQTSNQVGMDDLRRLKGSASRSASQNISLGPTSMFSSRSNSGRRPGPGGALGRPGEESGASSRTGTPPTRESSNAFSLLANMETENPASPPSTSASPALSKAVPADGDKKDGA